MKTKPAMLIFGILAALGVVTVGVFAVLAGLDYAQFDSQGLEGPTPFWILAGMAIGGGVAGIALIGLIVSLIGWASARRRTY